MDDKQQLAMDDVIFGGADHLFLRNGDHRVFDIASGKRPPLARSFATFRQNILSRRNIVEKQGAQFHHVIYPDKQSVLCRHYPVREPVCLGEQHLAASPEVSGLVFYPLELLRSEDTKMFLHTDTHMTDQGNIIATSKLVEILTGDDQSSHRDRLLANLLVEAEFSGDLGSRFTPAVGHIEKNMRIFWPYRVFTNGLTGGNNGTVDIMFSPEAVYRKRVLLCGDSFLRSSIRFLSYFFSEILFLRTPYFYDDIFHAMQPDLVVTSNVERYLYSCLADTDRVSFHMIPYMSSLNYAPGREFAAAYSAITAYPRSPYWKFVDTVLPSLKG